jgi:hypothetical protein
LLSLFIESYSHNQTILHRSNEYIEDRLKKIKYANDLLRESGKECIMKKNILGYFMVFFAVIMIAGADVQYKFVWDLPTNETQLASSRFYVSYNGAETNYFKNGTSSANFLVEIPFSGHKAMVTNIWNGSLNGVEIWTRVTCTDRDGNESDFSNVLHFYLNDQTNSIEINISVIITNGKSYANIITSRPLNTNESVQYTVDLNNWGTNMTKELLFETNDSNSFFRIVTH